MCRRRPKLTRSTRICGCGSWRDAASARLTPRRTIPMVQDDHLAAVYLHDIIRTFRNYRALAERALVQVTDPQLSTVIGDESNSLAIIVKHVSGNLRSRFADFLTSDGEKPDRNRDAEFETHSAFSLAEMLASWNAAWPITLAAIQSLTPADL